MNFLAHAVLSFENPDLMVGNFIADFVKGNAFKKYPEGVRNGILLHREIDQFTDQHQHFRKSKSKLYEQYGHYSGVIVDMYYDHFLAANFFLFHHLSLKKFSHQVYETVKNYQGTIPPRAELILYHMSEGNWLLSYRELAGIERALNGMGRRTRFQSGLEFAGGTLRQKYRSFYTDFMMFFPNVHLFAKDKIAGL